MELQTQRISRKELRKRLNKPTHRSLRLKYVILDLISDRSSNISELVELLSLNPSSLRKALIGLTVSGLISRAKDGSNRIDITPSGVRVLEAVRKERRDWLEHKPVEERTFI